MSREIPRMPSTEARHHPVAPSGATNVSEKDIDQGESRLMKSTGPAEKSLDVVENIKVVERVYDNEKMAMLAFMEEPITVRIATSTDKNAAQCFEINVNGRLEFFRRGETKTVKRYIVDRMLRLKETVYTQREVLNKEGIREYIHDPHTGLKYDFAIVRDDNKLGPSWERAILAERG